MPLRNNKKSCVEYNAFTVFCVCSSNYKKILLIIPFDSPFYELLPLLIFASFIDFLPSLSLQLHTGRKRGCKRISHVRFSSFKSGYMLRLHEVSGRKNVMSMRELFCPDPLAGFEKMARFQIFYCLKIKCFHS